MRTPETLREPDLTDIEAGTILSATLAPFSRLISPSTPTRVAGCREAEGEGVGTRARRDARSASEKRASSPVTRSCAVRGRARGVRPSRQGEFFPAVSVSLLVLSGALAPWSIGVARGLWILGAGLHLALAVLIIRRGITQQQDPEKASPTWFIPVVGNILAPVPGVPLGFVEPSWFFFAVGFVFWGVLLPVMFGRLVFAPALSARSCPTIAILMAPPAVGFLALDALVGGLTPVGHVPIHAGLFIALLLVTLEGTFARLTFTVSWRAFPSAALATSSLAKVPRSSNRGDRV